MIETLDGTFLVKRWLGLISKLSKGKVKLVTVGYAYLFPEKKKRNKYLDSIYVYKFTELNGFIDIC